MNHKTVFLPLCLCAMLLLTGCLPKGQSLIQITGAEVKSSRALIDMAHRNVLDYIISSSRVASIPSSSEWELENRQGTNGEYCFRSGNWTMLVWLADDHQQNQRVIIMNKVENILWWGYVKPDGHVVDTAYYR
jgi:hypothetical protein